MFINFGNDIINTDNITHIKRQDVINTPEEPFELLIYGRNLNMTVKFKEKKDREKVYNLMVTFLDPMVTIDLTALGRIA